MKMQFKDIYTIAMREDFNFDLVFPGCSRPESIHPSNLSVYGKKVFRKLLVAEVETEVPPPVITTAITVKVTDEKLANLAEYFCKAAARSLPVKVSDKLFNAVEQYPQIKVVMENDRMQILSLGSYRYSIQIDGVSRHMIYAWNNEEAVVSACKYLIEEGIYDEIFKK